jgi:proline dehydrogenase
MEGSSYTEITIDIFETVQRCHGNAGLAIQAYLRRSQNDLERLAPLDPKVRLVKGAYREPADVAFQKKHEVDANYRRLLDRLLLQQGNNRFFTAVGTHDPGLIQYAVEKIREYGVPREKYEFQMLLGIRRDLQRKVFDDGHPLRVYVPWGTAWCPYFMRRLAERPANLWFVLQSLWAERPAVNPNNR